MKNIDCNIICDLLPLYMDHVCSKQSEELVNAHLQTCEKCRKIFDEMHTNLPEKPKSPDFESRTIFRNICKNVLGIIIAIAVMISCFMINAWGALDGGPAEIGNLMATMLYLFFWIVFSIVCRNYGPLIKMSFIISLLTFISAANSFMFLLILGGGGFIAGFIALFSATPFYGLTICVEWIHLYAIATIFSLCWLIYTGACMRKLKKSLRSK